MKALLTSCVALVLMTSPVFAADAAPAVGEASAAIGKMMKHEAAHEHKGVFEQADANNDGIVTKDEFIAAEGKYFDTVDTNHDGKLSKDEIRAQRQIAMAKRMQWKAAHDKENATPAPAAEQK